MKGTLEMEYLCAARTMSGGQVFPHFPIHRRLEGVFHGERPAFNEEITLQRRQPHHAAERAHERRVGDR